MKINAMKTKVMKTAKEKNEVNVITEDQIGTSRFVQRHLGSIITWNERGYVQRI